MTCLDVKDLTLGYQTSNSASSSKFHHLALLVALVLCSSNFHHLPLLPLLVALVLHYGDSADLNFYHPIVRSLLAVVFICY